MHVVTNMSVFEGFGSMVGDRAVSRHFCTLLSATTSTVQGSQTSPDPFQAVVHVES